MGISLQRRTDWADQFIGNAFKALRAQRCWPAKGASQTGVAMRSTKRRMSR